MPRTMTMLAAALAAGLAGSASARTADAAPPVVDAVLACKNEPDAERRLGCYDRAVGALAVATAKGDVAVVDREDVRKTRRSLFGFNVPKLPFFSGDRSAAETPDEIETVVRSVRSDGYGKFTLVMTDGAVWRTTEAVRRDPKAGAKALIKKAALGSYMLKLDDGAAVRALRIG